MGSRPVRSNKCRVPHLSRALCAKGGTPNLNLVGF